MTRKILNSQFSTLNSAFTLIELLVVISIIGILAGMVIVSFTSSQKQARDTARKSDLSQYRTLLESFANKNNGLYPAFSGGTAAVDGLCTALESTNCPDDAKYESDDSNPYPQYKYLSDGSVNTGAASATEYVLWAMLENVPDTYWVICSSGQLGKTITMPTSSNCPTLTP